MNVFAAASEIKVTNSKERKHVAQVLTKKREINNDVKERIRKIASENIVLTRG